MGRGKSSRARLRRWAVPLLVVAAIAAHDLTVRVGHGFGARAAIFAIDEYRAHLSPRLRGYVTCRFVPTCSAYGREAIAKYGLGRGGLKTAWRLVRCTPMTKLGTVERP